MWTGAILEPVRNLLLLTMTNKASIAPILAAPENTGCFLVARLPSNEQQRLRALHSYGILDSAAEQAFDDLARIAALSCDMPIALISLVDKDRQWFKSHIGLDATQTHRDLSFCAHAILSPTEVMVVPDARLDERFAGHPAVVGEPHIIFYAGAPMVSPTGEAIGTVCIADHKPRILSDVQLQILRSLAAQAITQLEMRRSLMTLEATLDSQGEYVDQLERQQEELQEESSTDPLTGLGNRRAFQERLDSELGRARRGSSTVALMMLDVDFFKRYNDSFGHPAGDAVLRQLADVMKRTCRSHDFPARVGGEEFAVVLSDTTRESAFVIAERLRRHVQREVWLNRPVTISVGVALADEGTSREQLMERADGALYRSKRDGRNRVTLQDSDNLS
jgi:diguanylate cyclase (GGDEF)-like protein